jgi:S-DNA-T family DNA segregation ATPase FtsK/SpoIIIE
MSGYVCPECGLDYDTVSPADAAVAIRSYPRRYGEALDGKEDDAVRRRPEPTVWSAIEYTAHVADIFPVFTSTVRKMRTESHAVVDDFWDPDQRAAEQHYGEKAIDDVLADMRANAGALADEIEAVPSDGWTREATFPWGDRDLLTMVRNAVHEGTHHLRDVERVLGDR